MEDVKLSTNVVYGRNGLSCVDNQWAQWCINMRYCSVVSCKNHNTCQDKKSFFVPEKWHKSGICEIYRPTFLKACRIPKKWSVLCGDHFSPHDHNRASKRLRPSAIPFSNPQSSAVQGNMWFNFCFKKFCKCELFWFWREKH